MVSYMHVLFFHISSIELYLACVSGILMAITKGRKIQHTFAYEPFFAFGSYFSGKEGTLRHMVFVFTCAVSAWLQTFAHLLHLLLLSLNLKQRVGWMLWGTYGQMENKQPKESFAYKELRERKGKKSVQYTRGSSADLEKFNQVMSSPSKRNCHNEKYFNSS